MMKKLICLTLTLLLASVGAVPAFGADVQSKGLEQAILKAKNTISIPADYTEFQYSSYQRKTETGSDITVWSLAWSKGDGSASISARVDGSGNLNQFQSYSGKDDGGPLKVGREAGRKQAAAFLQKVLPDIAQSMRAVNEKQNASVSGMLLYTYKLHVNDIPVNFVSVSIGVDPYTGQVVQYTGLNPGQTIPEFPDTAGMIDSRQAAELYSEQLGAELKYYTHYDYQKKTLNVFLGYAMNDSDRLAIDAKTGKIVSLFNDNGLRAGAENAMAKDTAAEDGSGGGTTGLTPEEQAEVARSAGMLTKEKAESILRSAMKLGSSIKMESSYLGRSYAEQERFYWQIDFENANGTVDAKTGELLSFYHYAGGSEQKAVYSKEQASQKAKDFLQQWAAEKLKQSKELVDFSAGIEPKPLAATAIAENQDSYRVYYERQKNELGVSGNGLSVDVSGQTGEILSYRSTWYETAVFPSTKGSMDKTAAFEKFNQYGMLMPAYAMTGKGTVTLIYTFTNSVTDYRLNPISGERIDWRGAAYRDGLKPDYSDIKGHWAEATIRALLDNGYYLEGEQFQPDKAISQEDFLRYLYMWNDIDSDEFYKMLERNKIIVPGEKAPDKALTRQEAAKFTVRFLGFDALAQNSAIFKDLFKDKIAEQYKGYAAICYGLNIMKGDEKGQFNGTEILTRAEAACAIYQLLAVK